MVLPLDGLRVIDFSTLVPGPLATLILAEAGAEVIKIERPGGGDSFRDYGPFIGDESILFALFNRGKKSVCVVLKESTHRERLNDLINSADILMEQFRPGVMERLGLDYPRLSVPHPRLVYCSITSYGQESPRSMRAAHDLNVMAETGLISRDAEGVPSRDLPPSLIADIAGAALPAVIRILLALRGRDLTQRGEWIDISMGDGLLPFLFWDHALRQSGADAKAAAGVFSGGSPRYGLYTTRDRRLLAVAPLESRFWDRFCELIDLPPTMREASCAPSEVIEAVSHRIGEKTAAQWMAIFGDDDVCCTVVSDPRTVARSDTISSPHAKRPGVILHSGEQIEALPIPLPPGWSSAPDAKPYPSLGEANTDYGFDAFEPDETKARPRG